MGSIVDFLESRLGAFPSPWDVRHYRVNRVTLAQMVEIPGEYDELLQYGPTEDWPDQGDIGSCVGQDGAIVMEITNTLLEAHAKSHPELLRYVAFDLSAGWLYHWSRHYANVPDYVEGSTNLGLMKALNKKGTATEDDCPTDNVAPWDGIQPAEGAEERAVEYAIDSYWNVNPNPNDVKAAIFGLTHRFPYEMPDGSRGKGPLVSAYPVYESFLEAFDEGVVPMPEEGERFLGGHSSAIVGWRKIDGEEYWINFNSWGSDKGDGGLFYLPRDYPFYSGDFWLIHNGPPTEEPDPQPSPCGYGRGMAGFLNWWLRTGGRTGRFFYGNPR